MDTTRTTANSANGPDMTSGGSDMTRAQCLEADSQSLVSMEACSAEREDCRKSETMFNARNNGDRLGAR